MDQSKPENPIVNQLNSDKMGTIPQQVPFLEMAVAQSFDGIALFSKQDSILYANEAWAKMHQLTIDEADWSGCSFLSHNRTNKRFAK